MVDKFEIKSHDGPGRLGKLRDIMTPNVFDESDPNIFVSKDEESAYNVEREIAEWSVRRTIELAKEEKEKNSQCNIAVIQGSKYIDLRVQCAQELEKLGYNGLIIANGDDLLLHPRDLVDLIVELRRNIKPSSYLIFTFAECSFIPLLSYMGIDGFLTGAGDYYSYLNVLVSATKNYDLEVYKLFEMNQEQIASCNEQTINFVLTEVREHMKNKTLRNLVEERAATSPQNMSALKILDKKHQDYIQKYSQLY
ncbi:archaeosine tRNA-ribosyltransferase [Methanobrevibacter sp. TMH8]|uniref:archaeosine tRNA-ribosyltransferase n=1 Tax=Methanobrevibacter sp. TMH8 TaxID=2848611 RepID=UPI001CC9FA2E|nr:archaeosine tRNA-ribosyltransferase [Methanobrevibacter sp. TMH8]MBZ9571643.1 archaeosine tRNA-ribosyltransferase [Methanobrevibacter sp. TMH8]